jgi:hypothetical protein
MQPDQWLDNEDRVERDPRLRRLRWLADPMPKVDWILYGTGPEGIGCLAHTPWRSFAQIAVEIFAV